VASIAGCAGVVPINDCHSWEKACSGSMFASTSQPTRFATQTIEDARGELLSLVPAPVFRSLGHLSSESQWQRQ